MALHDVSKMLLAARFLRADRRETLWTSFSFLVAGTHGLPPVSLSVFHLPPCSLCLLVKRTQRECGRSGNFIAKYSRLSRGREWTGAKVSWPLAFYTGLYFSLKFQEQAVLPNDFVSSQ